MSDEQQAPDTEAVGIVREMAAAIDRAITRRVAMGKPPLPSSGRYLREKTRSK